MAADVNDAEAIIVKSVETNASGSSSARLETYIPSSSVRKAEVQKNRQLTRGCKMMETRKGFVKCCHPPPPASLLGPAGARRLPELSSVESSGAQACLEATLAGTNITW